MKMTLLILFVLIFSYIVSGQQQQQSNLLQLPSTSSFLFPGSIHSQSGDFIADNPVPVISSIDPAAWGREAAIPITLTLKGTGFVTDSVIQFNGAAEPTTFVSSTELKATFGVGLIQGAFPVTVVNPTPGGGTSNAVNLGVQHCQLGGGGNRNISAPGGIANSNFPASGGIGTISFAFTRGCTPYAPQYSYSWITGVSFEYDSFTGHGSYSFSVAPNDSVQRTGIIYQHGTYGSDLQYTVTQDGGCSYALDPTGRNMSSQGGTAGFNIVTAQGCPWTAVSNAPWLTITSNSSGTGYSTINYSAAPNTGTSRTGTITVAGQIHTVIQDTACSFVVSPTSVSVPAAGGTTSVTITASNQQCAWTASSGSPNAQVSPSSSTGNGALTITVPANSGPTRALTVTIAGQTITINQGNGCTFTVNQTSANFGASGGSGNITVTANDQACAWSSLSNVPWIATFSNGNNTGNGSVQYSVSANAGPTRTGTISVAGQTFTVNQSGNCTFSLSQNSMTFTASEGAGAILVFKSDPQCTFTAVNNASWIFIGNTAQGGNIGSVSFYVEQNTGPQRVGTITVGEQTLTVTQQAAPTTARAAFDFDGDGKADISVFRPANGAWYLLNSNTGFTGATFGQNGDGIVPADYDGDGKTDLAVYRNGVWYIQRSQLGFTGFQFGVGDDIPMPADYDGDGKADAAVFRPSNGTWYLQRSGLGFTGIQFGQVGDKLVAADFDGDGKSDLAVYRPSAGAWYIQRSLLGFNAVPFGISEDKPIAADFDADGKADIAVFRPSNGTWYLLQSAAGFSGIKFGQSGDLPTAADYDGDGRADISVYRENTWYINRSTQGFAGVQFGSTGDVPVENAYVR